jgi:tetratricopeptide (TPR) repeat protein
MMHRLGFLLVVLMGIDVLVGYSSQEPSKSSQDPLNKAAMKIIALNAELMQSPNQDQKYSIETEQMIREFHQRYADVDGSHIPPQFWKAVRENLALGNFGVAQFYISRGNYAGALSRLKTIIEKYPNFSRIDEVNQLYKALSQPSPPYPALEGLTEEIKRLADLPKLAKAALTNGETDKAVDYATRMIALSFREQPTFPERLMKGDLIYNGNYFLGMVAIKRGDVDAAVNYMLLSADTPGSVLLQNFGPNMGLAKELLDRGQRDAVLAFLKKCKNFWNPSPRFMQVFRSAHIASGMVMGPDKWIQEMEEGQTPDFGTKVW